jgi:hypothetical protein
MAIGNAPEKPWEEIKKNKQPKMPNQVQEPIGDDADEDTDDNNVYKNPAPDEPTQQPGRSTPLSV